MNFRQIEAFQAVMACGTVTRAAEVLRVSQPAVSRLLGQLERSTKLKLFERTRGRIRATPEGLAFHGEVQKAFTGLERLRFAAENIRSFSAGTLRVVSLPVLGHAFMPSAIGRFSARYPAVTVLLHIRSSEAVKALVASGQFDVGFAADEIDRAGVVSEVFATPEAVCLLPGGHRLECAPFVSPADLSGERFISLALEDATRSRIDRVFEEADVRRRIIVETQYSLTICNLVRNQVGVGLVNPFSLQGLDLNGINVKPFRPKIQFKTLLIRPPHVPVSRLLESFLSEAAADLRAFIGDGPSFLRGSTRKQT